MNTKNLKDNFKRVATDNKNGMKDGTAAYANTKVVKSVQKLLVRMGMSEEAAHSRFGREAAQMATPYILRMVATSGFAPEPISQKMHKVASHAARGNASRLTQEVMFEAEELIELFAGLNIETEEEQNLNRPTLAEEEEGPLSSIFDDIKVEENA